jgi:hypothetical protein
MSATALSRAGAGVWRRDHRANNHNYVYVHLSQYWNGAGNGANIQIEYACISADIMIGANMKHDINLDIQVSRDAEALRSGARTTGEIQPGRYRQRKKQI